ncbi:ABC transporter substrate-binding protein [Nocardioides sp. MJB4]|uniref:ABC transporter substrate-binding protein n=2 Tax=Nocardioides donggukensis TaxID=2774019 RepID=A0A927K4T1_9ACTN|nr:ABC transporter substrate-binding protein [Nocardioides donggukensis]
MLAAACGGGGDSDSDSGSGGEAGGDLRIYSSEPAFLVPTAANDEPSILVLRQLYRGLVKYNADSGAPELDLAESIESDDNKLWTIKVKEGYTFSNGEDVNADAFLRAWNYAGNLKNAQNNSYFFNRFAGFDDMQSEDVKKDTTFSGLEKVDDYTFTVELADPFSGFEAILGYSGFFPVAQECLDDFEACNEAPIGNGPYKMQGEWEHNVQITLERNDDYAGEDTGKADTLTYKIFDDQNTAYAAFEGGELDVMYNVPPEQLGQIKQKQGDRIYQAPSDSFTYVGLPLYDKQFDNVDLRKAFSLAIDRQAIIDAIFSGAYTPATGFVSPNFDGYREDVCDACTYDLEQAKELYEQSGGYKGKLTLWANAGAGHDAWLQAVGDALKSAFGIDYELRVDLEFPEYLELADNEGFDGPFRLGWGPDYPVMETYLQPLYGSGASSNSSGYENPEFDAAIKEGDQAASLEEAIPSYQAAEDMLAEDLPVIPMWFGLTTAIWSDNVDEFKYNTISDVEYGQITLK